MRHVAVVIPFFQRKPGLLRRAVQSVLDQEGHSARVTLLITDDESPIPATAELSDLSLPSWATVSATRTVNGGAAVARNNALERLPADADTVAFLDSDDLWTPLHLARALQHLDASHPLYFGDLFREAAGKRLFERWPLHIEERDLLSTDDPLVSTIDRDIAARLVFDGYVVTSTVVLLRSAIEGLSFPTAYFRFGEDQFFFLIALSRSAGARVSRHQEARYGSGVSIYADQEFGTRKNVLRLLDEAAFRQQLGRTSGVLPVGLLAKNREKLAAARTNIGMNLLASSLRLDLDTWRDVLRREPGVVMSMPAALMAMLREKRQATEPATSE